MCEHWVTDMFTSESYVLRAVTMEQSHTGVYIGDVLRNVWTQFEIPTEKRILMIRDGATNMITAAKNAEIDSVHCAIHLIQLVINDSLQSQRVGKDIIVKFRRMSTHFHQSQKAVLELKQLQNSESDLVLLPLNDVQTRWNSTYWMLSRDLKYNCRARLIVL